MEVSQHKEEKKKGRNHEAPAVSRNRTPDIMKADQNWWNASPCYFFFSIIKTKGPIGSVSPCFTTRLVDLQTKLLSEDPPTALGNTGKQNQLVLSLWLWQLSAVFTTKDWALFVRRTFLFPFFCYLYEHVWIQSRKNKKRQYVVNRWLPSGCVKSQGFLDDLSHFLNFAQRRTNTVANLHRKNIMTYGNEDHGWECTWLNHDRPRTSNKCPWRQANIKHTCSLSLTFTHSLSLSLSLSLCLSVSVSLSLSVSLCLSLSLSLSLSLYHSSLALSLFLSHSLFLSLSLSLTHTHTLSHTLSHTHTPCQQWEELRQMMTSCKFPDNRSWQPSADRA